MTDTDPTALGPIARTLLDAIGNGREAADALAAITAERDALRAEVERLRYLLERVVDAEGDA